MGNLAHHRDRLDASFHVVSLIPQEVESIMVLILAFSSFLSLTHGGYRASLRRMGYFLV